MAELEMDPLTVQCPTCFSKPGRDCTAPTETGRRDVTWFHFTRIDLASEEGEPIGDGS